MRGYSTERGMQGHAGDFGQAAHSPSPLEALTDLGARIGKIIRGPESPPTIGLDDEGLVRADQAAIREVGSMWLGFSPSVFGTPAVEHTSTMRADSDLPEGGRDGQS